MALVLAFGFVLLVSVSLSGVAARTVLSTALLFLLVGAILSPTDPVFASAIVGERVLAPPLPVASMAMVLLALVPRRFQHVQLPAVIGWAAAWVDGHVTGHWLDIVGSPSFAISLGC